MIIYNNFFGTLYCEGYKKMLEKRVNLTLINMLQSKSCLLALSDISQP